MPADGHSQVDVQAHLHPRQSTDAPSRTAHHEPRLRLARFSRRLHRRAGTLLALIMVALSLSGVFVAFKGELEYLQPASRSGAEGALADLIPPAQIAGIILGLRLPEAGTIDAINRIDLRPSKRMYKVRLEQTSIWRSPRELQVDATTGAILNDGVRGDQLWMDVHSFAVFGEGAKLVVLSVSGLALLWLCLSGWYLFLYPLWARSQKRRQV